jgi:hypothetical protein
MFDILLILIAVFLLDEDTLLYNYPFYILFLYLLHIFYKNLAHVAGYLNGITNWPADAEINEDVRSLFDRVYDMGPSPYRYILCFFGVMWLNYYLRKHFFRNAQLPHEVKKNIK